MHWRSWSPSGHQAAACRLAYPCYRSCTPAQASCLLPAEPGVSEVSPAALNTQARPTHSHKLHCEQEILNFEHSMRGWCCRNTPVNVVMLRMSSFGRWAHEPDISVPCLAVPCHAFPCHAMPCCAVPCHAVSSLPACTKLHRARAVAASVPSGAAWPLPAAAARQPLAGLSRGRFLLHFLPQPLDPPLPELSAVAFLVIPPGIKYDCN